MPAKSFVVDVNPAVLRWARESTGYDIATAAERSEVPEKELVAWETGHGRPKWTTVRRLARLYRRPVTALLLDSPPEEKPLPTDFRTAPHTRRRLSPETLFALRQAQWLVHEAAELEERMGVPSTFPAGSVHKSDDPEAVALEWRQRLGVTLEEQTNWQTSSHAVRSWRGALEAHRVFVFQFDMPEEISGFSFLERGHPLIALNQIDAANRRIFTLFHEYCHLLLAKPGMCLPQEGAVADSRTLETFCNRFAAAFLVPRSDFQQHIPPGAVQNALEPLSRRYRVSREVVLARLRTMGAISARQYQEILPRLRRKETRPTPRRRQRGGLPMAERVLNARGRLFTSLVLNAVKSEIITLNDATTYLGIKLKHLDIVASRVE